MCIDGTSGNNKRRRKREFGENAASRCILYFIDERREGQVHRGKKRRKRRMKMTLHCEENVQVVESNVLEMKAKQKEEEEEES